MAAVVGLLVLDRFAGGIRLGLVPGLPLVRGHPILGPAAAAVALRLRLGRPAVCRNARCAP